MAQEQLIRALGVWANGNGPLYRLLAQALQKAISQGDISGGAKLPPERVLSQALAVSRSTVVAAYNLLQDEGWVESRQGSGTVVIVRPLLDSPSLYPSDPTLGMIIGQPPGIIDLSTGAIGALSGIVQEEMVRVQPDMLKLLAETGYSPLGLPALRQAIARRYTHAGTPTNESQILVTTGAQQAIWLVGNSFVQRDETVLIENPTYFGALDMFRGIKARLVPFPVGENGIRLEQIRSILASTYPRLIYLMPAFHNPTGRVLSSEDCRRIVRLAEEFGIPLVEDMTLEELSLGGENTSGLAYHAREGVVISIGSISKLFWAGIRVGWLRAPEMVINRLTRLKVVNDLGSGLLGQVLAARLLERLDEARIIRQNELVSGLDYLTALLQQHLPSWSWSRPAGGLFLWVRLPEGDAGEFSQLALRYGVRVAPGEMMSVDQSYINYLRLSFFLEPPKLEEAVRRLARAWANYPRLSQSRPSQIEVMV